MLRRIVKKMIFMLLFAVLFYLFLMAGLNAMEREREWREARHCQYYGEEINRYYQQQGKGTPCHY